MLWVGVEKSLSGDVWRDLDHSVGTETKSLFCIFKKGSFLISIASRICNLIWSVVDSRKFVLSTSTFLVSVVLCSLCVRSLEAPGCRWQVSLLKSFVVVIPI